MTRNIVLIPLLFLFHLSACAQEGSTKLRDKTFRTSEKVKVQAQVGFLLVPENRTNPDSRTIKVKFIRLKSLAEEPKSPIIFLEGSGQPVTWQAEDPASLHDWVPLLEVADVIFIDQRGTTDQALIHIQPGDYPQDFFVTADAAQKRYVEMSQEALKTFEQRGVDVAGYTIEEHAQDVQAVAEALKIKQYTLYGYSFGSHIGMMVMKMYPETVEKAVLLGADGIDQSFNYPAHLDAHLEKISAMVAKDSSLSQAIPDFSQLLERVLDKLDENPAVVSVKHPVTGKSMEVPIGRFGLSLILRLDIDDTGDIIAIPRLLYQIERGNYEMLTWFVQKRIPHALAVPANGINQALASGVSTERWAAIERQAQVSSFGNVVNFPFAAARAAWPRQQLKTDTESGLSTDIPTLFISGDLDARTPAVQVEETMKGFGNATHVVVANAGHEQVMWNVAVFDKIIPGWLRGEDISGIRRVLKIKPFLPLTGPTEGHPSVK